MRLALYQPDIPQNVGAAIRLTACIGVPLDIVEPCGFPLTDKALKRAAMDYAGAATLQRHDSLAALRAALPGRLILVETGAAARLDQFAFEPGDTLILGRESAGSPSELWEAAHAAVRLPMTPGLRSLNVVTAAAMALWEAMRQTGGLETLE